MEKQSIVFVCEDWRAPYNDAPQATMLVAQEGIPGEQILTLKGMPLVQQMETGKKYLITVEEITGE